MNVALIMAKRGSLGAPDKNIYQFRGKPLLNWTLDAVIASNAFSHVFVSTNCTEIGAIAANSGATAIMRDDSLAANSRYVESVNHAIHSMELKPETITIPMVVQPIREDGIFQRILALHSGNVDSVVTVKPFDASPSWIFQREPTSEILQRVVGVSYGNSIARSDDLFLIDNAVVSFSYGSWKRSDGITPWPYLGKRIIGVVQRLANKNYHVDINVPEDIEWLEFVSTYPEWKRARD